MKKAIIASTFMVFSAAALAAEPPSKDAAQLPQFDNHQACVYQNVIYSKGAVVSAGQSQLQCMRGMGVNGFRGDENPLEWVKLD